MARGFRGVRDDFSELGRHLLDIACFLHPLLSPSHTDSPPPTPRRSPSPRPPSSRLLAGILADLAEIGGTLRGGLSRLSSYSASLRAPEERDTAGSAPAPAERPMVICVSDGVLDFVRDVANRPEAWIDFPTPVADDFVTSHLQRDHVAVVEQLVPDLVSLRLTICPAYMNEDTFWKIYFALLHSKLDEQDSKLLLGQAIIGPRAVQSSPDSRPRFSEIESIQSEDSPSEKSIQQEDNQPLKAQILSKTASEQSIDQWVFTKTRSQQSMDQWSDIPSDADNLRLGMGRRQFSTEDLSSGEVDRGNFVVLERDTDSLAEDGGNVHTIGSTRRNPMRRKPVSFGDYSKGAQQMIPYWATSEDSEFEIVDSS